MRGRSGDVAMRSRRTRLLSTTVIPLVVFAGFAVAGVTVTQQLVGAPAYAACTMQLLDHTSSSLISRLNPAADSLGWPGKCGA